MGHTRSKLAQGREFAGDRQLLTRLAQHIDGLLQADVLRGQLVGTLLDLVLEFICSKLHLPVVFLQLVQHGIELSRQLPYFVL